MVRRDIMVCTNVIVIVHEWEKRGKKEKGEERGLAKLSGNENLRRQGQAEGM